MMSDRLHDVLRSTGLYDKDNSGSLDFGEFRSAVRKAGQITSSMIPDDDLRAVFSAVDADGGGDISLDELARLIWGEDWTPPPADAGEEKPKKKKKKVAVAAFAGEEAEEEDEEEDEEEAVPPAPSAEAAALAAQVAELTQKLQLMEQQQAEQAVAAPFTPPVAASVRIMKNDRKSQHDTKSSRLVDCDMVIRS